MEVIIKGIGDLTIVTVSTAIILAPRAIDAYLAWRDSKDAPEEVE
jgi:hypothetical protein